MKRFIHLLGLLCLLLPGLVQAQTQPISLQVELGLDGILKPGAWGGARITLANTGNDVVGEVDWRWQGGGPSFGQTIDLPRGANKQIVLPVYNFNFARAATVRFLVNNRVVAEKNLAVEVLDQSQLVVGVVSDEGLAFPELDRALEMFSNRRLVQLQPSDLPERPELLESINTLVITADTTNLNAAQQAALAGWVVNGGQLLLNGGQAAIANGLPDLAPATPAAGTTEITLRDLGPEFREFGTDLKVAIQTVQPKPDVIVHQGSGQPIWAVERNYGNGTISQATFDLGPLSASTTAPQQSQLIWSQVLPIRHNALQQNLANDQNLLQSALGLPALRLPSLLNILLFLLSYIVLVGPINYLVLRRFDRREWAYITIPITVMIFTLGAYVWGTAGRGGNVILNELSVVRVPSGGTNGQVVSHVGLFSPTRSSYTLRFPAEALLADSDPFRRTTASFRSVRTESGVELPEVLVDVGALESFIVRQSVRAPLVSVTITGGTNGTLTIRNQSDQLLRDLVIVKQRRGIKIADLAPGETRESRLPTENEFVEQLDYQTDGVIDHRQVVSSLVNGGNFFMEPAMIAPPFDPALPPDQSQDRLASENLVTVLAWVDQTQLPIQIDGTARSSQGETLLIVGGTYVDNR